jgi:hypothetical protein
MYRLQIKLGFKKKKISSFRSKTYFRSLYQVLEQYITINVSQSTKREKQKSKEIEKNKWPSSGV